MTPLQFLLLSLTSLPSIAFVLGYRLALAYLRRRRRAALLRRLRLWAAAALALAFFLRCYRDRK